MFLRIGEPTCPGEGHVMIASPNSGFFSALADGCVTEGQQLLFAPWRMRARRSLK